MPSHECCDPTLPILHPVHSHSTSTDVSHADHRQYKCIPFHGRIFNQPHVSWLIVSVAGNVAIVMVLCCTALWVTGWQPSPNVSLLISGWNIRASFKKPWHLTHHLGTSSPVQPRSSSHPHSVMWNQPVQTMQAAEEDLQGIDVSCPSEVLNHPKKRGIDDELTHPEVTKDFAVYTPDIEANYIRKGILGKGAFGEVLRVFDTRSQQFKALKRIPMFGAFALKTVTTEVAAARQMGRRPFVVQLEAAYVSNSCDNFILVYELCDEPLSKWINRVVKRPSFVVDYGKPMITTMHLRYAQDLILGLECMYNAKIIHRDLKPDNILIKDGHIKIGDFGVALVNRTSNRKAVIGDLYFMDQKTLVQGNQPPDYMDDIYSMGQVFARMFYGKYASAGELLEAVAKKLENGEPVCKVEDLIYKMTCPRPDRISYEAMKEHPLFEGLEWPSA